MYYNIVPMDRSHIPQIAALERECFSTPWTENMLEDALFDSQASFIVAEAEDGSILGYAGLHVIVDEGYIDNIAVEEAEAVQRLVEEEMEAVVSLPVPLVADTAAGKSWADAH